MITREEDYKRATGIASHMKVAVESSTLLPTDVAYMDVALKEGYDIGITADIEDLTFKFPLLRHGGNVRMKLTPGKSKR